MIEVTITQVLNGYVVKGPGGGETIYSTLADVLADLPHAFPMLTPDEPRTPANRTGQGVPLAERVDGPITGDGSGEALPPFDALIPFNPWAEDDMTRCPYVTGHDSIVGDWQCRLRAGHDGAHVDPVGRPRVELTPVMYLDGTVSTREWSIGPPWQMRVRLIHCDPLVLHAPGVCGYCDKYGADLQSIRAALGVAFTAPEDRAVCVHGWPLDSPAHQLHVAARCNGIAVAPDPAEVNRPGGVHQQWGGNRPSRPELSDVVRRFQAEPPRAGAPGVGPRYFDDILHQGGI